MMQRQSILWAQVCGVAAVQASISLAWVTYGLYIPQLLEQAGYPDDFANRVLTLEALLAIPLEPTMGALSERARVWMGSRFPFIALGIGLAALIFMVIPLLAGGSASVVGGLGLLLPIALVAWAIAMTIFRSPILGLLAQYAVGSGLAQAVSIVILFGAIAGSTGLFARNWILSLGPVMAFGISSAVLLLAALVLRWSAPDEQILVEQSTQLTPLRALPKQNLLWVFAAGAALTVGLGLMRSPLQSAQTTLGLVTIFTITHLLSVLPAGWVAGQTGARPALAVGAGAAALGLAALGLSGVDGEIPGSAVGVTVLLGIAFSFIQNGTIPFALGAVPSDRSALGVGMYFGGVGLAGVLLKQLGGNLSPTLTVIGGCLALAIAAFCVWSGSRQRPLVTL